jgi:methionyl-tRNA synthetase
MLAGVGGIDLAMLIIAADEGVMPQTREHLAICSLLRVRTGLVALTKIDTVEADWIELVRDDVAALVRGTFLEGAPVVPVSAKTGAGLEELRKALRALAVMLAPILPEFAPALAAAFGQPDPRVWPKDLDPFSGPPVAVSGKPPQIPRLDAKQVAKLIVTPQEGAAPQKVSKSASPAESATKSTVRSAPERDGAPAFGVIGYDDFARVELRVGLVQAAEPVPKADKLLRLSVDVGEAEPRTIVAGIAQAYPEPRLLVGRRIVVVANLAPKPLRGITSHGMLLAAGEPPNLQVVTVGDAIAPGTRVK